MSIRSGFAALLSAAIALGMAGNVWAESTRKKAKPPRPPAANENVMPALLQAAECRTTVQECMDALADVFGRFRPSASW